MGIRNSIDGALPQLIDAESQLRQRATALGISYDIADYGGVRTFADTVTILGYRDADYAAAIAADPNVANIPINTWRPIAPFGSSFHNYGAAFDVKITSAPAGMSFDDALQELKSLAPSVGLSSSVANDPPHFELPISLDDARAQWSAQGNPIPNISVTTAPNIAAASTVGVVIALVFLLAYLRKR